MKQVDERQLVEIAVVVDSDLVETAKAINKLLEKAGIECFIEGSTAYSVSVRARDKEKAINTLKSSEMNSNNKIEIIDGDKEEN